MDPTTLHLLSQRLRRRARALQLSLQASHTVETNLRTLDLQSELNRSEPRVLIKAILSACRRDIKAITTLEPALVRLLQDKCPTEFSKLMIRLADAALQKGQKTTAIRLLEKIPQGDKQYANAMELLLAAKQEERDDYFGKRYFTLLSNEPNWRRRLASVRTWIQQAQHAPKQGQERFAALNKFFADIAKWVPEFNESYGEISQLICEHVDLFSSLPNLFDFFSMQSSNFLDPEEEEKIWTSIVKLTDSRTQLQKWRAHAILHLYVAGISIAHGDLECMFRELAGSEALKAGDAHARKNPFNLNPEDQARILATLAFGSEDLFLQESECLRYLENHKPCPSFILKRITNFAQNLPSSILYHAVVFAKARTFHLSSQEWEIFWQMQCKAGNFDVALRVATILYARKRLPYAWQHQNACLMDDAGIVHPLVPNQECLRLCFFHLGEEEEILCRSIMMLGEKLATYFKLSMQPTQSPPLFANLVHNHWGQQLFALVERLGLNYWHWDINQLQELLRKNNFTETKQDFINSLTPEETLCLDELRALRMEAQTSQDALGKFVVRMSLLYYPSVKQALASLQIMQAPLPLIWDLEAWLVSGEFASYLSIHSQLNAQAAQLDYEAICALP